MKKNQRSVIEEVRSQIRRKETLLSNEKIVKRLPDKGERIRKQLCDLQQKLKELEGPLSEEELSNVIQKYKSSKGKSSKKNELKKDNFRQKYEDVVLKIISRQEENLKKRRPLTRDEEKKRMLEEIELRKGKLALSSEKEAEVGKQKKITFIDDVVRLKKKEEVEETEGEDGDE